MSSSGKNYVLLNCLNGIQWKEALSADFFATICCLLISEFLFEVTHHHSPKEPWDIFIFKNMKTYKKKPLGVKKRMCVSVCD